MKTKIRPNDLYSFLNSVYGHDFAELLFSVYGVTQEHEVDAHPTHHETWHHAA